MNRLRSMTYVEVLRTVGLVFMLFGMFPLLIKGETDPALLAAGGSLIATAEAAASRRDVRREKAPGERTGTTETRD